MSRKLSDNIIKIIEQQAAKNISISQIARNTNVSYSTAYFYAKLKPNGYETLTDYHKYLLKKRGYESRSKYQKDQANKRKKQPINQKLSNILIKRLLELNKTQKWLSEKVNISRPVISGYISGEITPKISTQTRLFKVLDLPYKTLDDLIEEKI